MIHARINKDTLIVASVEVASPDWVEEWTAQNPESAYFYAVADISGNYAASPGWSFDSDTQRYIPPTPDAPGAWEFDRGEWAWIDRDAPPIPLEDDTEEPDTDTPQ